MKKASRKFFHVCTSDREDWATELEAIPPSRAKQCDSCGKKNGLFLREANPTFNVANKLNVRTSRRSTIQCKYCWTATSDGSIVAVNKKGETIYPYLETIVFAKNFSELADLVRRWKGGLRFNSEIETPWGMLPVITPEEAEEQKSRATITCPNCKIDITLNVIHER